MLLKSKSWPWLLVGTAGSLLAYHGRWGMPLAAWVFAIFLLRFTRSTRVLSGAVGIWVAYVLGGAFYLAESGIEVFTPMFALILVYSTLLAVPYLLDRLLIARLPGLVGALVFPTAMVGAEYVLGALSPMGVALSSLGTTQHANLPLIQLASITGTYGITFILAWFSTTVLHIWERRLHWPDIRLATTVHAAVLALVLVGGTVRIAFFAPDAQTVRVATVSPAKAVDDRSNGLLTQYDDLERLTAGDPAVVRPALALVSNDLLKSTEREAAAGAQIVVWPEAGTLVREADRDALLLQIAAVARQTGIYINAGLLVLTQKAPYYARNQAVLIDPRGKALWTYDKSKPVPGMDMIEPGDGKVPVVDSPVGRIANVICFDADFPSLMRQQPNVDLMLVPSNDWQEFGRTHTEKAALRAVENGYSLIRADSRGQAGAFDPLGRSVGSVDYFTAEQQTMVVSVPTHGLRTLYTRIGDVFTWLCLAGLVLLTLTALRRRDRER
ncbi:apolipoprotein N-acyltransferase [Kribbella albertanoniae]|uniref:Nitrilase n=1 Tax=Kribbella albertanoniae TaxID=1266829 RepID=A0A4V2XSI6_9ACTN|nr:nitrilase-related carbon-nitrogen hydrolase [Kribbella albertanoniae]TDC33795.1 nitrilase [Kribbella albertanoniae]